MLPTLICFLPITTDVSRTYFSRLPLNLPASHLIVLRTLSPSQCPQDRRHSNSFLLRYFQSSHLPLDVGLLGLHALWLPFFLNYLSCVCSGFLILRPFPGKAQCQLAQGSRLDAPLSWAHGNFPAMSFMAWVPLSQCWGLGADADLFQISGICHSCVPWKYVAHTKDIPKALSDSNDNYLDR